MEKQYVAVITGASKGLGKALALSFAKEGYSLGLCARGNEELDEVVKQVEELGATVVANTADVTQVKDVDRFISVVEDAFGSIDVLINNASTFGPGPTLLADYPADQFEEVIRVNTSNPFLVTKRVLPGMLAKGKGSIINVTSEVGKTGLAEWGAYSISKFGLEGLTAIWADELDDTGVRVNMVDPGEMNTEMHETAVPDCDYELALPDDVVDVFLYLASEQAKDVNGERYEAQSFTRKGSELS
ncbi:SDR family NAD(P)-dependent oxidoreductase [Pontibacillus yanchengensis]|uniref:SDR family NAD(P)-dependent oxidoreductase n=2 Tax=Pontibacillus yanchengensis TaxID=462910 RepID=A0ACC7VEC8_9BACI|nr:SDR family oxidoreductase [Pontibacillus yanchengensis]MYL32449.1 SDR family NAD(P)-dependent oxidoreductase [Pontibacillus yanchengensis]MYL53030.1 SDR family NAD(P)-dependent oxidoreductase [Pontibacillus yanchengensis]